MILGDFYFYGIQIPLPALESGALAEVLSGSYFLIPILQNCESHMLFQARFLRIQLKDPYLKHQWLPVR